MNYGRNSGWIIEYSEEVVEDLRALGKPAQLRIRKYLHKLMASHRSRSYSVSSIEDLMKRVHKLE